MLLCGLASRTEEKGERELFSYCGYYVYHSCHRDLRSTMGVTPQTQRAPQINPPPFRLLLFGCFITTTRKVTNAAHSVLCGLRNKSLNSKSWSRERSWNIILQPETNSLIQHLGCRWPRKQSQKACGRSNEGSEDGPFRKSVHKDRKACMKSKIQEHRKHLCPTAKTDTVIEGAERVWKRFP